MKKHALRSLVALGALAASSAAWAVPIATVGGLDTYLASTTLKNSGDAAESAWVSTVLGFAVTFESRTNCDCSWQTVDSTPDWFAFDFGSDAPSYYLVKTGNGSTIDQDSPKDGSDTHFLFQNVSELQYAVVSMTQLGFAGSIDIKKVSHITEFDGGTIRVPEPAGLAVFGLALLGVAVARRRLAR